LIKLLLPFIFAALLLQAGSLFGQINQSAAPDTSGPAPKKLSHDAWLGKDKFDHAIMSAGMVAAQFYFLHQELDVNTARSRQIAAASALTIGIAKEIYDRASRRGTPSWKDLLADGVGVGVALVLVIH
jgi:uncharacterized protein YfiM (DUF2279 family)